MRYNSAMLQRLKTHKFTVHTTALALMLASAVMLYPAAQANAAAVETLLLAAFALGAALTILV